MARSTLCYGSPLCYACEGTSRTKSCETINTRNTRNSVTLETNLPLFSKLGSIRGGMCNGSKVASRNTRNTPSLTGKREEEAPDRAEDTLRARSKGRRSA